MRNTSFFVSLSVLLAATAGGATASEAQASQQCLSRSERLEVAQMASVMGIGAALQRCTACLGSRYQATLDHYEANHLLEDFRIAEASITQKSKFDFADGLVRQSARDYAYDLSADCNACAKAADTIDSLDSAERRSEFYAKEAARLAARPELKDCP